jgi:hypothetical protein
VTIHGLLIWSDGAQLIVNLWHKKNFANAFAVLNEVMGIGRFIECEALRNLRLDGASCP